MSTFTRYLLLFAILNAFLINLPLLWFTNDMTVLHYTGAFLDRIAYNDSWVPMRQALQYLHTPELRRLFSEKPLYAVLFFDQKVKFQYPLTSLLLLEPLRVLSAGGFIHDDLLNTISWAGILLLALMVSRIFTLSISRYTTLKIPGNSAEKGFLILLSTLLTLTFYPLLKGYVLGQVQVWIDVLFAAMVLSWMEGRKKLSGVLAGFICIIKPQLLLLLLWGIIRKEKKFVLSLLTTVGASIAVSLFLYGWENNLDYYTVVSFIAQHGESYFPNQSVNGLLNRMFFNGNNLQWVARNFPPYQPIVFWGTLVSSVAIVGVALLWRLKEKRDGHVLDLATAVLSFTIASPVAWEHHYGILLPLYAISLPATLSSIPRKRGGLILLALTYFSTSTFLQCTDKTAPTIFNFVQSYLFIGAAVLLVHLYRLRPRMSEPSHGTTYQPA